MFEKVFGSRVDWISQHSVFPEYFRQLFYETGDFFPEYAPHIGGGQNIFHFSYYGLHSPLILPSYFLPFVKMSDYLIVISILCLLLDGILFSHWLKNNGISKWNRVGATSMFLLSGPLIFHSYTHIMFVNYMPFLLLGLLGVDHYWKRKRMGLLTISVFLMILTSYYFSVGGLAVLGIYGIYRYLSEQDRKNLKITWKTIGLDGLKFLIPIGTGILMSCFLIVPTAVTLFQGERRAGETVSWTQLLELKSDWGQLFYSPYGIGLTTLSLTVLFTGMTYRKWKDKYIHFICFAFVSVPFVRFLLNGGLYIRGKGLIPMLPLLAYLVAEYLEKITKKEVTFWQLWIPSIFTLGTIWLCKGAFSKPIFYQCLWIEAATICVCIGICYRACCEKILILLSTIFLFLFSLKQNVISSQQIERPFYQEVTSKEYSKIAKQVLKNEDGLYRMEQSGTVEEDAANLNRILTSKQYLSSIYSSTYHRDYQKFRTEVFQLEQPYRNSLMQAEAKNPIFRKLMGVKYILSKQDVPGYKKIEPFVYENKNVFPILHSTNQIIAEEEYEKLEFPYNQIVLANYVVAKGVKTPPNWKQDLKKDVQKLDLGWKEQVIDSKKEISQQLSIPQAKEGDVFFLQFQVENQHPSKDVSISLEGIRNKLTARNHIYYNANETFTYAITLKEGQKNLQLKLGKGAYRIYHTKSFLWKQKNSTNYQEFHVDRSQTEGNRIRGIVRGMKDGYLVTSIPYDPHFSVEIDGKAQTVEKVNVAFMGTKIEDGNHTVEIIYQAPGVKLGMILSAVGWLIFIGTTICYRCAFLIERKMI